MPVDCPSWSSSNLHVNFLPGKAVNSPLSVTRAPVELVVTWGVSMLHRQWSNRLLEWTIRAPTSDEGSAIHFTTTDDVTCSNPSWKTRTRYTPCSSPDFQCAAVTADTS